MTDDLRTRLDQLSPAKRALLARRARQGTGTDRPVPRPARRHGDEVFPCSYSQRRAWLASQLTADGTGTAVATAIHLRGPLDVAALTGAVADVVARHEALRTVPVPGGDRVPAADDGPRQRVVGELTVPLRICDEATPAVEWIETVRTEPFDLECGPLFRTALLRLGPAGHVFLLAGHHFVLDAASLGIVVAELAARYAARISDADGSPPDVVQYPDVAVRQRRMLAEGRLARGLDHWRTALAGVEAPVDLPLPPPAGRRSGVGEAVRLLPPSTVDGLTAAAGASGRLSLGPILLTAYQLLLRHLTGRTDVAVGAYVGGRTEPGTEQVVGDFTNVIVVRTALSDAEEFPAAVRRVSAAMAGALAHQDVPFEAVIAALAPPRRAGRPPLVQFGFNVQDNRLHETVWAGLTATVLPVAAGHTDLDLTLVVLPTDTGDTKLVLEYAADRFAADAVDALADRLTDLLTMLTEFPDRPVGDLVPPGMPAPAPAPDVEVAPVPYTAARTDGEELVAEVFAEVLGAVRVGVHDDFFALGGHSLHAMRVVGRITAAIGLDVPIRALFTHPTVAGLTPVLEDLVTAAEQQPAGLPS